MSDIQKNVPEGNPEVQAELKHREAVNYLRKRDCEMLSELKGHHENNIKLWNIFSEIQGIIADLGNKLKTPKPKINKRMLIISLILSVVGIGVAIVMLPVIVLAVVGIVMLIITLSKNKKATTLWQGMIDSTKAELAVQEKNADNARKNAEEHWENVVMAYIKEKTTGRFPEKYATDYNAVCFVLHVLINMRADNIKEGINLYEDMLFRNEEIAILTESVRYAARTAVASERSARANEEAAMHAAETAAAAAATAAATAATAATLARGINVHHSGSIEHHGSVNHYVS